MHALQPIAALARPTSITPLEGSDLEYVDNYKYLGVYLEPNTIPLVLEMFNTNLFISAHSYTILSSLLSTSVSSLHSDAALYIVESSAYMPTLALFITEG